MKHLFISFMLLCISLPNLILSYLKFPLYTYHTIPPNKTTDIEYINYFLYNKLYTYLNIGTPPQKMVATINFVNCPFYIYYNRCEISSNFDINQSSTYIETPHQSLLTDIYVYTYLVNDFFYFDKDEKYNLTYLFSPLNKSASERSYQIYPYTCADIGLRLSSPDLKSYNYNFIRELKKSNAIKDYVFFIEYDENNNDKGNLIIGDEAYEYNNKKYKYEQLKEIYAIYVKRDLYWDLNFNSIYFQVKDNQELKTINLEVKDSGLNHNLNIISATYEFYEVIEKEFFNEKIKNNTCKRNILKTNYYNYDCNSIEDVKEFPTLYFTHRNLGYTFELNYKDVFVEYNGRFMCLIWINMGERESWELGKPFLKKYFFTFNIDKKIIGFYNLDKKDNDKDEKKINPIFYIVLVIVIIILISSFSWSCYLFAKFIYLKRKKNRYKKLAKELLD